MEPVWWPRPADDGGVGAVRAGEDTDDDTVIVEADNKEEEERKDVVDEQQKGAGEEVQQAPPVVMVRPLGPQFPELYVSPNAGCGDCQFWALAQAINNCHQEELTARLCLLQLVPGGVTATQLRRLAYTLFLLPTPELDGYLAHWKTNSGDPSMGDAYRHARFLADKRIDTLTRGQREELFQVLMDAQQTWGDETSLILLERLLRVRVDVITNGHLQIRDMCHPAGFTPLVYTAMNLSMKHYECIIARAPDGSFVTAFPTPDLPLAIVALHRRDCAAAVDAYVRLVEPADGPPLPPLPPYEDTVLAHLHACQSAPAAGSGGTSASPAAFVPPFPGVQVEAEGGLQQPGRMDTHVCRLQCGLRVGHPPPYEPLFAQAFIPARIPGANPCRLWA